MDTQHYRLAQRAPVAITFVLLLLGTFLGGCASSPKAKINPAVEKIVRGVSTKEEVKQLLGYPTGINKNSDGAEVWTYSKNDLGKKMAKQSILTGARMLAARLPIIGSALTVSTAGAAMTPQKTTSEITTINFDEQGIVTAVSTSVQTGP